MKLFIAFQGETAAKRYGSIYKYNTSEKGVLPVHYIQAWQCTLSSKTYCFTLFIAFQQLIRFRLIVLYSQAGIGTQPEKALTNFPFRLPFPVIPPKAAQVITAI
jgi:hypothetical protein